MSNITTQDLLLIIGDQTVTIAALRQQLQEAQAGAAAQAKQLENALKNKAVECDQVVADAKSKSNIVEELRRRLELVRPHAGDSERAQESDPTT